MASKKTTRRALFMSIISLLLCCSMLVGTTFAWFTDEVTSGRNTIAAGNLDVELYANSEKVDGNTVLFNDVDPNLWEPGAVAYENLQVKNVGTLALKYNLQLTVLNESVVNGYKLSDVIMVGVVDGAITGSDRNAVISSVSTWTKLSEFSLDKANTLAAGAADTEFGIVLYWRPNTNEIDNHYNMNNGRTDVLKLDIGVNLYATQVEAEEDSFGPDYDEGLVLPEVDGTLLIEKDGIQYYYDEDGSYVLYLVTEAYTSDTVNVPEGVDRIGNYAFAYNSNVKTVVLSPTVRDLGRGFDSSAVEEVVLNEGLQTISSRAFRSTTALQKVVIPSTVTEIADNAFQKSGIKSITIPATVQTVGETAFGASTIESVTFEGNTAIQGYAFRGCPNLHTVTLNGDDVTFIPSTLNGRNSTWFCNSESNNPNVSNITFYVVNNTVADRVKTAMGAEANNTPIYINGKLPSSVTDVAGLSAALKEGGNIVLADDIALTDTLMTNEDVVIDLNGKAITAPANGNMFHSGSDNEPSIIINSSVAGAEINISGGDTAVLLGYGSTEIKNVTINVTGCDNSSPSPFNVYGDLTIGEGTVVNVDYLGSALINNNGKVTISIDGAKFNIGTFKRNGVMIDRNNATTFEMKNTTMKIDNYVLSQFGGEGLINKIDGVTIENCTFDITDSNGASCTFVADAGLGRYDLVQK